MQPYRIPDELIQLAAEIRGRLHLWDDIPARKTALVVVDMQKFFLDPAFQGGLAAAQAIVPNINRLARAMRERRAHVIWISNTTSGTLESWSVRHEFQTPQRAKTRIDSMQPGADGFSLWPGLDIRSEDTHVTKSRYSAFAQGSSNLLAELRRLQIEHVLIAGTLTNVCCQTTAQDAMMLNFRTAMIADCCAGTTPEVHAAALNNFFRFFGDVLTVDEVVERLAGAESA